MKPKIWAHRGASAYATENTLEAFELAVEQGADGVELDIQCTKDQQLVVFHDEKVDRLLKANGWVKDFTLDEIKSMTFHDNQYQKVPTLQEVYELLRPIELTINVELKNGVIFYENMEQMVLTVTEQYGMKKRVLYSSFNHLSVKKIKELQPDVETGILISDVYDNIASYAKNLGVDAVHPALYYFLIPDFAKVCKEKGLKIHVWTVNEQKYIQMMIDQEVDAIITDKPDLAKKNM